MGGDNISCYTIPKHYAPCTSLLVCVVLSTRKFEIRSIIGECFEGEVLEAGHRCRVDTERQKSDSLDSQNQI